MTKIKYLILRSRPLFIIFGVGLMIYAHTFNSPFHFDDQVYIVKNNHIRSFANLGAIWEQAALATRFVTFFTFAVNYHFHYLNVFGYHVVNVLIHILNGMLVYWLVFLSLSTQSLRYEDVAKHKKTIGLLVALVFVAHPLQTQAVTYITQRFASLATFFYLASVCFYVKGRLVGGKYFVHPKFFILSLLTTAIGVITKEIVFTLAFAILLFEFSFLSIGQGRPGFKNQIKWGYLLPYGLITFIIPGVYAFNIRHVLFESRVSGSQLGEYITSGTYFLTQFKVILVYLKLLFVPIGQNLLYDFPVSKSLFEFSTFISALILIAIIIFALRIHFRYTLISFGILWFFITLAVESSIIPIQHVIFEHRVYLPMVGFSLSLIIALFTFVKDYKKFITISCVIIAVLSCLTIKRNFVYQSEEALWADNIAKAPQQSRSYLNLGIALMHKGKIDLAIENFDKSIELDARNVRAFKNRANAYMLTKRYEDALNDYSRAIKLNPRYAEIYSNRGVLYSEMKRYNLAVADYTAALEINPKLAEVYNNRAFVFQVNHKYERALEDYDRALELNPKYVRARINRGNVYKIIGQNKLAIEDYTKAITLSPKDDTLYYNRASVYSLMGDYDLALNDFNAFIRRRPGVPVAYYSRSLIYQAKGDKGRALTDALKAQELGYQGIGDYINQLR